jgi:hypothetical protein
MYFSPEKPAAAMDISETYTVVGYPGEGAQSLLQTFGTTANVYVCPR